MPDPLPTTLPEEHATELCRLIGEYLNRHQLLSPGTQLNVSFVVRPSPTVVLEEQPARKGFSSAEVERLIDILSREIPPSFRSYATTKGIKKGRVTIVLNSLEREKIFQVYDLVARSESASLRLRGIGTVAHRVLVDWLESLNLRFGMLLSQEIRAYFGIHRQART